MSYRTFIFALLFTLLAFGAIEAHAKPTFQDSSVLIRMCYNDPSCNPNTNYPGSIQVGDLDHYTEQVLTNEWHQQARLEALKAGAVVIRTFAYRFRGCGAYVGSYQELPIPPIYSRVLDNRSQRYWLGDGPSGGQNPIATKHSQARAETQNIFLYRDGDFACAKHFTYTGNPTQSCVGNSSGQCPGNSDDQYTLKDVAEPISPRSTLFPAMSQNGSAAWAEGPWAWTFSQMLTHYYRGVTLAGTSSAYYRWNWLNVGNYIVFQGYGGEGYYGPTAPIPLDLDPSQTVPVTIHLQNASRYTWSNGGSNPIRLGYHWYTASGSLVTWDDGRRGNLSSNLAPSDDAWVTINVRAPSSPGAYQIRFDPVREGISWFSQQNNWPTLKVIVAVGLDEKIFLPIIFKNG